jgi:hypothetical protein
MKPNFTKTTIMLAIASMIYGTTTAGATAGKLSPDEVAMLLSTLVVAQKSCDLRTSNYPLNLAVAKLGQDLVDFTPDGRYAQLVEVKLNKAIEWLAVQGKSQACLGFKQTLTRFLPDTLR